MQTAEDDVRAALTLLYPQLRRFALTLTGSHDAADDLVQITCEKALSRASRWCPAIPLRVWLLSVMRDAWEHEAKMQTVSEFINENADQVYWSGAAFEDRLLLDCVRRKLHDLPEEQESVLTLVGLEGCTYKEAAKALNIQIGTVMSRLFRGRHALSRLIDAPTRRSVLHHNA
jgi:RNA polymerase sigma-70 factor, ECF subfamily